MIKMLQAHPIWLVKCRVIAFYLALPTAHAVRSYAHEALGAACAEVLEAAGIRCHR
ncbi:hypothetical protein [Mucilaginibacter sp.]|uniref:hypothetical protein n=1 Tax=Mucilaginibacter sp. TaxID=1882438 RepID=UPI00261741D1|nr:hypothetical protein [Mucilaginibacter sp.]